MADTFLLDKRDELKYLLTDGGYKTLLDVVLDATSRAVQRLIRRPESVSYWTSAGVMCLLILLISAVTSHILRETGDARQAVILIEILGVTLAFVSLVIFKVFINWILSNLRDHIIDAITSEASLEDLRRWLRLFCNVRLQIVFCLAYGLTLGVYTSLTLSQVKGFIGYGPSVTCCLVTFIWAMPMYFLFVFLALPTRLGGYDYRLYKADPSSSEVVSRLASLLQRLVYLYAVVATGSMVYLAFAKLLDSLIMVLISIVVAWLPITILFFTGHYALRKIIVRAKQLTLGEIQAQVEQIQADENLADKETMDKVNRLMDYHDRVKATKDSLLDLGTGLSLFNSLLLPALGFVLGNPGYFNGLFTAPPLPH